MFPKFCADQKLSLIPQVLWLLPSQFQTPIFWQRIWNMIYMFSVLSGFLPRILSRILQIFMCYDLLHYFCFVCFIQNFMGFEKWSFLWNSSFRAKFQSTLLFIASKVTIQESRINFSLMFHFMSIECLEKFWWKSLWHKFFFGFPEKFFAFLWGFSFPILSPWHRHWHDIFQKCNTRFLKYSGLKFGLFHFEKVYGRKINRMSPFYLIQHSGFVSDWLNGFIIQESVFSVYIWLFNISISVVDALDLWVKSIEL